MFSAPTSTAPAAVIRPISAASRGAGGAVAVDLEPARVGRPATSKRFFTAKGTPASGPSGAAGGERGVDRGAPRASARSAVTSVKALSCRFRLAIARQRRLGHGRAVAAPPPTAAAISGALAQGRIGRHGSPVMVGQAGRPARARACRRRAATASTSGRHSGARARKRRDARPLPGVTIRPTRSADARRMPSCARPGSLGAAARAAGAVSGSSRVVGREARRSAAQTEQEGRDHGVGERHRRRHVDAERRSPCMKPKKVRTAPAKAKAGGLLNWRSMMKTVIAPRMSPVRIAPPPRMCEALVEHAACAGMSMPRSGVTGCPRRRARRRSCVLPQAARCGISASTMAGACCVGVVWKACAPISMPM